MGKVKRSRIYHINIPDNFKVPFPPEINPDEVLNRRTDENLNKKHPNSFFVYRLAYLKELKKHLNIDNVSMNIISPHIGDSWAKESIGVKNMYKQISDQVREQLEGIRRRNFVVINEDPRPRDITPPPEIRMHEIVHHHHIPETVFNPTVYYFMDPYTYYQFYFFYDYYG